MRTRIAAVLGLILVAAAIPIGAGAAQTFVDDNGNPHEASIEAIAAAGITRGCNPPANDRFCPDAPVTRAEMAAFIVRAMGRASDVPGYQGLFSDVAAGQWFTGSVELAAQLGVTTGYEDGTFRPNQPVSRGEMSALLLRAIDVESTVDATGRVFADVGREVWFAPWVEQMYDSGITNGCATDPLRYCPYGAVRRDEMATFVTRAFDLTPITPDSPVPPAAGFPDASNTGVPAGTALQASGTLTITQSGTVIDGYDVRGEIYVNASNVTIRNTRVRSTDDAVIWVKEGLTGVVIEDCELDGSGQGIRGVSGPADVRRCNIYGVENGVVPHGNSQPIVVEGNYVHGLSASGSPHYDGIEIGVGHDITIRGNTVINEHDQTAAFGIWNDFGSVGNILVENNRFIGGGYTVYVRGDNGSGSVSGITIRNNRLGRGYWGYASIEQASVNWSGNVDDSSGATVSR